MASSPPHLTDVQFRIWWHLYTEVEKLNSQFLHFDYYPSIRDLFPIAVPTGQGEFSYTSEKKKYEVIDFGQTSLKYTTTDKEYRWKTFSKELEEIVHLLLPVLDKHLSLDHVHLDLGYTDFFDFDYDEKNVIDYLPTLKLNIEHKALKKGLKSKGFTFVTSYQIDQGSLNIQIGTGIDANNTKGVIMKTSVSSGQEKIDLGHITKWYDDSHQVCSEIYKNILK